MYKYVQIRTKHSIAYEFWTLRDVSGRLRTALDASVQILCAFSSKLLHFDSPSVYCIIMSMRMVADVETLEASDQKDHNEFVTTYDVEGTQTELEKVMDTFGKPTLSYVGDLLAYSNALVNFDNPKLGEDNDGSYIPRKDCSGETVLGWIDDPKPSCIGACVSYTDHDDKSGLANIDKPKPSCGGAYVSYKHIGDNTGLANFKKPKLILGFREEHRQAGPEAAHPSAFAIRDGGMPRREHCR